MEGFGKVFNILDCIICVTTQIVLIILKAIGKITWSWFWVLSPIWIAVALWIAVGIITYIIIWFEDRKEKKNKKK